MKCCVYTRFVYEVPYIESFITHYLELGFDKIIILYHDITEYNIPERFIEDVELINVENSGNKLLNEYKHVFQDEYDWVLNVDADEFLLLDKKYESIHHFISEKLEIDDEINLFQFSWGWLHAFNPPMDYTLTDYINNYKICIGSKDTDNDDIWVKSMAKISDIEYMTCHNCVLKSNTQAVIYVNCDILRKVVDESLDEADNEDDDDDGEESINLLPRCYALREETYLDAILVHVNTRNMMNAIIKGLNIHVTQVKRKRIKKFKQLKKFVNNYDFNKAITNDIVKEFTSCLGYKMKFPLLCLEKEEIHEKIRHLKLSTTRVPLCKSSYMPNQNRYHLDDLQQRMNSIFYVLDMDKFIKLLSIFGTLMDNSFKLGAVA